MKLTVSVYLLNLEQIKNATKIEVILNFMSIFININY